MHTLLRTNALLALLLLAPTALAGTRYVNVGLSTGANDGSSWTDAHQGADGLATALSAAVGGDQIWVAAGSYLPTTSGARTLSFQLKTGVEVFGGFAGFEASLAQRNVALNVTILSGDLAGNDPSAIFTDNSYHVVNGAGTNASAVLDGFHVRGGNANGAANQDRGGGILCMNGANPTIRQTTFSANRCTFGGGAGYINSSSPTFTDCVFDGNFGGSYGGAFDMATGVGASFDRCRFTNNSAARAGGIEIFGGSTVKVFNSLFQGNVSTSGSGGGAMYISGSSPQIRNCTILNNVANAHPTGGILGSSATPSIVNCIIDQNLGQGGASGVSAQVNPTSMSVSYSMVTGYAGAGNVAGPPIFDNCGPAPLRLSPISAGVDAGSNAGLPLASAFDLSGQVRRTDNAGVPDTGLGSAPLIDMGAYESSVDCNANSISDACDVLSGFSNDVNANGIPDECECFGGATPIAYCSGKFNSQFCLPVIAFNGYASVSSNVPFLISASEILNNKAGLLLYGLQSAQAPFQGGTLCVGGQIKRTPVQTSGGTPPGSTDCTGTFSIDFNAFLQSGVNPLLQIVGQQVNAQYWSRDPQDPFGTSLTNAVQFGVCQ